MSAGLGPGSRSRFPQRSRTGHHSGGNTSVEDGAVMPSAIELRGLSDDPDVPFASRDQQQVHPASGPETEAQTGAGGDSLDDLPVAGQNAGGVLQAGTGVGFRVSGSEDRDENPDPPCANKLSSGIPDGRSAPQAGVAVTAGSATTRRSVSPPSQPQGDVVRAPANHTADFQDAFETREGPLAY